MIRTPPSPLAGAAALFLAAVAPSAARAAESYDNCAGFIDTVPAVIATQGTWCLRKDVATAQTSGSAIVIATNNVTLDCNHFKVGGLAAGLATWSTGIAAANRLNATVRNCNVRGFAFGLSFNGSGGGGHLVVGNRFDGNTMTGLYVEGTGNTVRGNLVFDTGGSTLSGLVNGIWTSGDVDVMDNTVDGIAPGASPQSSIGIASAGSASAVIQGNRVRRVDGGETGLVYGIISYSGTFATIQDNHVAIGLGSDTAFGISCQTATSVSGNRVRGFDVNYSTCEDDGDNVENP